MNRDRSSWKRERQTLVLALTSSAIVPTAGGCIDHRSDLVRSSIRFTEQPAPPPSRCGEWFEAEHERMRGSWTPIRVEVGGDFLYLHPTDATWVIDVRDSELVLNYSSISWDHDSQDTTGTILEPDAIPVAVGEEGHTWIFVGIHDETPGAEIIIEHIDVTFVHWDAVSVAPKGVLLP